MWSILRGSSRNPGGEECTHGVECGRTGGRAGSDGRSDRSSSRDRVHCPQRCGVYCEEVPEILAGKSALMALNAVEQVAEQVPADDFQALEDKIYRTIEMYKAARQAQAAAERDAQRVRQQMQDREEELVTLRRETVRLKKEREEIRGRVEKMLQQIESIAEAS